MLTGSYASSPRWFRAAKDTARTPITTTGGAPNSFLERCAKNCMVKWVCSVSQNFARPRRTRKPVARSDRARKSQIARKKKCRQRLVHGPLKYAFGIEIFGFHSE